MSLERVSDLTDDQVHTWTHGPKTEQQWETCNDCNYDTHMCPGCGEWLYHGTTSCGPCDQELGDESYFDPSSLMEVVQDDPRYTIIAKSFGEPRVLGGRHSLPKAKGLARWALRRKMTDVQIIDVVEETRIDIKRRR